MKKVLKVIGKVLLILLAVLILFLLILFIYHRIMINKEKSLRKPIGQLVEVDGHKMSIYAEGDGKHTLVFMAGSGVPSPILEYKSLYSLLSDDYKVVVIEKFGYGFSDFINDDRSFETILRQDREALEKAGINGPFILCPHSMSGLEAILWAQRYPNEVEALIGLDMSVPSIYKKEEQSDFKDDLIGGILSTARKLGLARLLFRDSDLPNSLTENEKDIYKAILNVNYANRNMIDEGKHVVDASDIINSNPKPNIPTLMFISDGSETGGEEWIKAQKAYASDVKGARTIDLDCGHMINRFKQDQISKDMKEFIKDLDQKN